MAKNLQEYIEEVKAQQAQPKAEEEKLTPEEAAARKKEKLAFDYANTMWKRGGCYTSEQMNKARAVIQEKIDKGEIKL